MGRKTYKYRELIEKLVEYDSRFEVHKARGKGSERMIYHPNVNGRSASYPITCHGEGKDIKGGHLAAIRRRFNLPAKFFE